MDILGSTSITIEQAQQWAKNRNATDLFISLAKTYWDIANSVGVNPSVAYAQSFKETNGFNFGGVLDESYCNPCGMKITQGGGDYDPNAHMRFNSWNDGISAFADHIALYAGQVGYPKTNTLDPRHFPYLLGKCKTVESLGGCYAPSLDYGTSIVNLINEMANTVVINNKKGDVLKMKVAIRGGHNNQAIGALGILNEVVEDRKVKDSVIKYLKSAGVDVLDVTPGNCDTDTDLAYGVNKANAWGADLFLSIHFNKCYNSFEGEIGTEAEIYGTGGKAEEYAKRITYNVAGLGFKNRGSKIRPGLYELRETTMPAVIYEVCFVEATGDVAKYNSIGCDRIGKRIAEGIVNKEISLPAVTPVVPTPTVKKSVVIFGNQIDKRMAEYLSEFLNCDLYDGNIPTDYSKFNGEVIGVGAVPPNFGKWTCYLTEAPLTGSNRFQTVKLVSHKMGLY